MEQQECAVSVGQRVGDLLVVLFRLLVFIPALALALGFATLLLARATGMMEASTKPSEAIPYWMLLAAVPMGWRLAVSGKWWRLTFREDGVIVSGPWRRRRLAFADLRLLRLSGEERPGSKAGKDTWLVRLEAVAGAPVRLYLPAAAAQEAFRRLLDRSPHAAAIDHHGETFAARSDPDGSARAKLVRSLAVRGLAVLASGLVTLGLALFGKGSAPDPLEVGRQIALRGLALIYGVGAVFAGLRILGQLRDVTRKGTGGMEARP